MENEITFLEPVKAGHVFFYDTETGEVVHFRRDIYEAAQESNEGMNLVLTKEEQQDAEDAWAILDETSDRYQAMPAPDPEVIEAWEAECADSAPEARNAFLAEKMHQALVEWLDGFNETDLPQA